MRSYSDITLKYLKKNKKRSLFTIIGIILSLSLISGVGFLGLSFRDFMYDRAIENNGDYEFGILNVNKDIVNTLRNDVDLEKIGVVTNAVQGYLTLEGKGENSIYITEQDKIYSTEITSTELTEGEYPKSSKELILNSKAKEDLGVNIGDDIKLREVQFDENANRVLTDNYKEYKIVGFIKEQYETDNLIFSGEVLLDSLEENKEYNIFFTVSNSKNKSDLVNEKFDNLKLDREVNHININNDLLALRGESSYEGINTTIEQMIIFVLGIIILATIFLIYNAINISVTERMEQFGILRSIGATPKQVSNIVIREGLAMCLLSIPFGVIFGFLGVWTTVKILDTQISNMFGGGQLIVKFYLSIILFTLIVGSITIFIATLGPAKKAGKVSPISVIKGNSESEKIKHYNGKLIKRIFGVEGWVAYKNIRKNSKRFTVTILSLSISLIMFITFTTLNMKRIDELDYLKKNTLIQGELDAYENINKDTIEDEIKSIDGIGEVYTISSKYIPYLYLDGDAITDDYKNTVYNSLDNDLIEYAQVEGYSDEALNKLRIEEGLKNNEVAIVNSFAKYNSEGQLENINFTNIKVGDIIKVAKSSIDGYDKEDFNEILDKDKRDKNFIEFKVKKIINKSPFDYDYSSTFKIIMNYDEFTKMYDENYYTTIGFRYENIKDEKSVNKTSKNIQRIAEKNEFTFNDINLEYKSEEEMWNVANVFVYGFIVMVTLIGVVNVVNTISLNILLKKKEFGTLGTIGMSNNQLSKMVLLEGILHGIFSSIVAGILSIPLVLLIVKMISYGFTMSNKIYWQPFVIGFTINLLVVLIASLIPLNKLKKMSLVETIRNIE
ncbi:ABC transporter permease [uncultured Clostridium sp.]|uniref:ABC transporter permease n=1 Tax=uncultured Clostridium sp. TaxID=59620 RepID=UPI0025D059B3|nr:FtsX-like permease family protein [uncultured Clostridium sp.]MDU4884607.1 FtsX-like permease family protein [Clostridium celatum]MDU7077763.1 FtsX-like permease family protein [Clostridium celatum]